MQKQTWTIKSIISWTSNYFSEKDVDAPRISAELLLGSVLDLSRVNLYINYDKPLSDSELKQYKTYIQRRIGGEPTQYITGTQEFWSLDFKVTPSVLIPRADTETLVERALAFISTCQQTPLNILEIGTGSGAISIAIAHELKERDLQIKAIDISEDALKIAEENATLNGVAEKIEFLLSDKFNAVSKSEKFDLIISNPPYISEEFYDKLESKVKDHEPKLALYADEDGLIFYREIFSAGHGHLNEGGCILIEIDHRKKDDLISLVDNEKYSAPVFYKDLPGLNRVLEITKRSTSQE